MAVDLTKLILESNYNSFKNNNIYTGTQTITGTVVSGTNTRTFTRLLNMVPDMVDITFNGPTDSVFGTDPRPADGWFKQGQVWALTSGALQISNWKIFGNITGPTLTITAIFVNTTGGTETLTNTNFSYRVIDYSVFG